MVAAENAAARSSTPSAENTSPDHAPSRDQISQALASKDPAWFRQTADRGANSAAYRKSQVEDPDTVEVLSGSAQLAGMSRPTSTEPQRDAVRDRPSSQIMSSPRVGSPLLPMTEAQKLGPPADIQVDNDGSASGRTSPTRPASPTKGMGGFVQSAMMKRTDSVKRWSVTTPGLQRGNTAANRSSYDNKSRGNSPGLETTSRPVSRSRENSSRPTSSHAQDVPSTADTTPSKGTLAASPKPEISIPEPEPEQAVPTSPSRTMDPRRWSPTKSSWLDAALKQPESPKPKPQAAASNQPAWMVELNKAKAARAQGSADIGRAGSAVKKHEVKTGGLVRPAPMGTTVKPPSLSGIRSPPLATEKPLTPGLRSSGLNSKGSPFGSPSPTTEKPPVEKPSTPTLLTGAVNKTSGLGIPSPANEEPERRGSVAGHELAKERPDIPPKKDFRAGLRQRGTTVGNADKGGSANELANVFGKLRKTTTQNYVAPDELKDNILRGKSGLNVTGGPRPYVKKDEFKDAILARKADFQQAKQEGRSVTALPKPPQEQVIPEGIARRATISRKSISHSRDPSTVTSPSEESTKVMEPSKSAEPSEPSPRIVTEEEAAPKAVKTEPRPLPGMSTEKSVPGKLPGKLGGSALANRFNPALAGLLARGPPGMGAGAPGSSGTTSRTGASDAGNEPGPGPQLSHMTKNRARGPRRRNPASATKPPAPTSEEPVTTSSSVTESKEPAVKGSERNQGVEDKTPAAETPVERSVPVISPKPSLKSPITPPAEQSTGTTAQDTPQSTDVISLVESSKDRLAEQRPLSSGTRIALVDSSKPSSSPSSPKKIHEQVAAIAAKAQPVVEDKKVDEPPPRSPSPRKLDVKRMSKFLDEPGQPSPKEDSEPSKPSSPVKRRSTFLNDSVQPPPRDKPESTRSLSPVKRMSKTFDQPSQPSPQNGTEQRKAPSPAKSFFSGPASPQKLSDSEKVDSEPVVSVKNGAALFGGRSLTSAKPQKHEETHVPMQKPVPAPLELRPTSPAKPLPANPLPAEPTYQSPLASPTRSPSKSGSDVSAMLKDFFGNERSKRDYRADAGEILMNRPRSGATVQTQKAQLFHITEQGKRVPVSSHYERVLFEREMYICAHTFTNTSGKKVQEVYFWAGDEVPSSVIEDAQVFVNREARSLGGTLIKMSQGKETAEFIQALGGIVIIRRGSSNKYDSLASNMLCGRQYLGQVVFDEVDFAPLTLCSGFPYIINQSGKCYLWKGKGSGVDELSCARLIGMDFALMGELVEVEEGKESEQFWDLFAGRKKMSSAEHWKLKPDYEKYCGRLFCSDAADRTQVCCAHRYGNVDIPLADIKLDDRNQPLRPIRPLTGQDLCPGRFFRVVRNCWAQRPVPIRLLPQRSRLCTGVCHPRRRDGRPTLRSRVDRRPRGRSAGSQELLPQMAG